MRLHDVSLSPTQFGSMAINLAAVETLITKLVKGSVKTVDGLPSRAAIAALVHLGAGGQHIRARLALHAARACGMTDSDGVVLATTSELLHNASLVHDDIQDQSQLRRGVNAIWVTFGTDVALCAGDLLLSAAYAALSDFSDTTKLPALLTLVHGRTSVAIRGQCADLFAAADNATDAVHYETIAVAKSGALLSLPLELVYTVSESPTLALQARMAVEHFAIGYQIADDIEDLARDAEADKAALNIVLLLGGGQHALSQARDMGLRHLNAAASAALALPNGAGSLLRDAALCLAAALEPVVAP